MEHIGERIAECEKELDDDAEVLSPTRDMHISADFVITPYTKRRRFMI